MPLGRIKWLTVLCALCLLLLLLLLLVTTSVGINLVSARRLVLHDMLWNPVHNKQVSPQAATVTRHSFFVSKNALQWAGMAFVYCCLTCWSYCLLTAPLQAISRVWRYGQTRPCYIYHLLYGGTFETRVFERVLVKEELFQRVRGEGWE